MPSLQHFRPDTAPATLIAALEQDGGIVIEHLLTQGLAQFRAQLHPCWTAPPPVRVISTAMSPAGSAA